MRRDLGDRPLFEAEVLARAGAAEMGDAHHRIRLDQGEAPAEEAEGGPATAASPARRARAPDIDALAQADALDPVLDVQRGRAGDDQPADLQAQPWSSRRNAGSG